MNFWQKIILLGYLRHGVCRQILHSAITMYRIKYCGSCVFNRRTALVLVQVLVVLAAVTCIVAMLLVAAIVFVRRRHQAVKPSPPPPLAVTWVNSTISEDFTKTINTHSHMLDSAQQQQQQPQRGIVRATRTAATLPLLRVNDLLRRDTPTTVTSSALAFTAH